MVLVPEAPEIFGMYNCSAYVPEEIENVTGPLTPQPINRFTAPVKVSKSGEAPPIV